MWLQWGLDGDAREQWSQAHMGTGTGFLGGVCRCAAARTTKGSAEDGSGRERIFSQLLSKWLGLHSPALCVAASQVTAPRAIKDLGPQTLLRMLQGSAGSS